MYAYGESYTVMFLARSIQGVGSACISVAGMLNFFSEIKLICDILALYHTIIIGAMPDKCFPVTD